MIKLKMWGNDDDFVVIENSEAHKAYYLFNHPEARSVFKNGSAVIGKNIRLIEPALNEIMGWNPTYKPQGEDWNELRVIDAKIRAIMALGAQVATLANNNPKLLEQKLSETIHLLPEENKQLSEGVNLLANKMRM